MKKPKMMPSAPVKKAPMAPMKAIPGASQNRPMAAPKAPKSLMKRKI
jgi:hypothetical protein